MEIFNKDVSVLGELTLNLSNATGNFLSQDGTGIIRFRTPSQVLGDIGGAVKYTESVLSTGLYSGGLLSIHASTTSYTIASGYGIIVDNHTDTDNPTITHVNWDEISNISPADILTQLVTYVCIDSNGNYVELRSEEANEILNCIENIDYEIAYK